jgi:bifunctional DNase/RNase
MLEAEIWGVAETVDGYMIFIKPLESDLSVPIFVGQLEAQAILVGFGGISLSRPLTIDLLQTIITSEGMEPLRVEINDLKDNTFFGRIVLKKSSGDEFTLDARPSDALALAVRCSAPIFVDERVLEAAGIPADELSLETDASLERAGLQQELEEAVAAENYERAAEIRDILQSMDK